MKRVIGQEGKLNGTKLAIEFREAGINVLNFTLNPENLDLTLEYADEDEGRINEVIAAHDPTPEPEPLSDIEQTQLAVAEAIEKQEADKLEQQLAQAEMFETILQMLEPQGGGE